MKSSDVEKLRDIADAGGARHLADALIRPFDEVASSQGCESRLLKHGVLYQRGSGNAVFSLYFSRTSSRGSAEIAIADENIARLYNRSPEAIAEWLAYLTTELGESAKSPTSQGYPRVSVSTVQSGLLLAQAMQAFLRGEPYRTPAVPTPAPLDDDGRFDIDERVLQAIWTRRGQPEFRARLIQAYGSRCAITGCDVVDALEAAHITPFADEQAYSVSNGLLLRGDIHTLFDLLLLSIDPTTWAVHIAPHLSPSYAALDGVKLALPTVASAQPDAGRLLGHYTEWCRRWHGASQ